jgi:hypothetical protein
VPRITKVLIAVPSRPGDTHKDSANLLALVLAPGARLVSEPILLVSNQGTGTWAPFSTGQFPNLFTPRLNPEPTDPGGSRLVGYTINNRDENLARLVEATFTWEGRGPEIAQTSVENKHGNSPAYGEGVSVAFSVPQGTAPVQIVETFAEGFPTAPFSATIPKDLKVSHGVPLSFPLGFQALTQTLGLMNGHGVAHRFVRLTAHTEG